MTAAVGAVGYAEATLTDVTTRARVSRKTFYVHFADKEACFVAAFDALFADLLAVALDAFRGDGSWPERLAAALRAVLATLEADRLVARICFVEALTAGPCAARVRNEAMTRFGVLYRPEPDERSVSTAGLTSRMLAGGVADIVYRRLVTDPGGDLRALLPDILRPTLTVQLGPAEARRTTDRLVAAA